MIGQNGAANPIEVSGNSTAAEGTGNGESGSLLTGNIEASTANGEGNETASQQSTAPAPKQRPAWKAQATKELQDDERLDRFQTISDVGKAYLELEGKLGRSIAVPGDNATAEEWESFYKKIGRPETPDDYEFDKTAPDGVAFDADMEKEYRQTAIKLGLNKKQAAELWNLQKDHVANQVSNQKAARVAEIENGKAVLREKFGANMPRELEITQTFARNVAEKLAPGLGAKIDAAGLGNDPQFVLFMNHFAHRSAEDSFIRNGDGSPDNNRMFDYSKPAGK